MADYSALIARLEALTGPNRKVDHLIHRTVVAPHLHDHIMWPAYTHSLDAALALMPDLVSLKIETGTQNSLHRFEWPVIKCVSQKTGEIIWKGQAATLPITIAIAALKARAEAENG